MGPESTQEKDTELSEPQGKKNSIQQVPNVRSSIVSFTGAVEKHEALYVGTIVAEYERRGQ